MKRLLFSILFFFSLNLLFAHIDRPIDALIFENNTYDAYSQPLASYIKNDRKKKQLLVQNPPNPRLPKHYYATYEIKESKLYLNKVEVIIIKEVLMRYWRLPLALDYSFELVEAEKLFGDGAKYPIFCEWYSGEIFANIFDGDRDRDYLFAENSLFKIENGNFVSKEDFNTRNVIASCVPMQEAKLMAKSFSDNSFSIKNMLFDLRCIADFNFLKQREFDEIKNGQIFKTRGYLRFDSRKTPYLVMPKTRNTKEYKLMLLARNGHDISEFKTGDRVEATIFFAPNSGGKLGLLGLSHLGDDELLFNPDFPSRLSQKR